MAAKKPCKKAYLCSECSHISIYEPRDFYRATKPKCMGCGCGNLKLTRAKSKQAAQPVVKKQSDTYRIPLSIFKGCRPQELTSPELHSLVSRYKKSKIGRVVAIFQQCQLEIDSRKSPKPAKDLRSQADSGLRKGQAKKPMKKKVSTKWDGHDEARHQTLAELEEINAVGVPITYVSGWIGGRPDWSDHIPTRDDQLAERALKFGHSS